jgi:hypothetical protein
MTPQKLFDKVAEHLLTQGKKSVKNSSCQYRGSRGTSCAIGCLIPDELYDDEIEGLAVDDLSYDLRKACGIVGKKTIALACDLQLVHDKPMACEWPERLRQTALKHGLNPSIVSEVLKRTGQS